MKLCAIAAMSKNRVIGVNNELPWDIPEELRYFKEKTKESIVIMGRKTFESMGGALPKRSNFVVTRSKEFVAEGAQVFHSLEKAIAAAEKAPRNREEVFVIGGAEIYKQSLDYLDLLYLTIIDAEYQGDAFFPEVDFENQFKVIDRQPGKTEKPGAPAFEYLVAKNLKKKDNVS